LGRRLFGGWTLLVSVLALLGMSLIFNPHLPYTLGGAYADDMRGASVSFSSQLTLAFWLMLCALVLLWVATGLLFWQGRRSLGQAAQAGALAPELLTERMRWGRWLMTEAALLWGASFFFITWVNGDRCGLISSRCGGRLATEGVVLTSATNATSPGADLIGTLFFLLFVVLVLVAGGGLLVILLAWQHATLGAYKVWVLLWLALTTLLSLGAALELFRLLRHSSVYALGPGLPLTLLALGGIWAGVWLRWRDGAAQPNQP
jgi:hypothetical protein